MAGDHKITQSPEAEAARKLGQEEAWELARKILQPTAGYPKNKIIKSAMSMMICNFTYAEASERIQSIEESKTPIKAGSVVIVEHKNGIEEKAVITKVIADGKYAMVKIDGLTDVIDQKDAAIIKTGRTLPVKDWLRKIGEVTMTRQEAIQEPERRHGHWVDGKTYYDAIERNCSECGQLMTTARSQKPPFCPHCGAIMDECVERKNQ